MMMKKPSMTLPLPRHHHPRPPWKHADLTSHTARWTRSRVATLASNVLLEYYGATMRAVMTGVRFAHDVALVGGCTALWELVAQAGDEVKIDVWPSRNHELVLELMQNCCH